MLYDEQAFSRDDESEDRLFYATERMVSHLDSLALRTVERVIDTLVVEERPEILDLMASWDSHLPAELQTGRVVGLGLNRAELERNDRLDEAVIHDLNRDPSLPFEDASFDVVLNTVSVDYLVRPFEVFREVGRVLRPGGLHLVVFSNRMFPTKAVRIWRDTAEEKRVHLVQDFFNESHLFGETTLFVHKGHPRPADDRYAGAAEASDPVYVVYANRLGAERERPGLAGALVLPGPEERARVEARKLEVGRTLRCPYCDERLLKWAVPWTPFTEWDNDHMYVCFNDSCAYLVRGWSVMASQGMTSFSYRFMFDPERGVSQSIPIHTLAQLRDGIVDE
jgi:SAM-dependent methyltransferase